MSGGVNVVSFIHASESVILSSPNYQHYHYRNAYKLVINNYGEKLYSGLEEISNAHLKEVSKYLESIQGGMFLVELNRKWEEHTKALQLIQDILMYMDRTFVPSKHKTPVHKLGLNLWLVNVIHSPNIWERLLNTLLDLIQKERSGQDVDRELMKKVIKMLMDLGGSVYKEDFEKPFLEISTNFYQFESRKLIECCGFGDYLKKAEKCLNQEIERVSNYMDIRSEPEITKVVETEMIANHMPRLVHMQNVGPMNVVLDDKCEELGRIHNIYRRLNNGLGI